MNAEHAIKDSFWFPQGNAAQCSLQSALELIAISRKRQACRISKSQWNASLSCAILAFQKK